MTKELSDLNLLSFFVFGVHICISQQGSTVLFTAETLHEQPVARSK